MRNYLNIKNLGNFLDSYFIANLANIFSFNKADSAKFD